MIIKETVKEDGLPFFSSLARARAFNEKITCRVYLSVKFSNRPSDPTGNVFQDVGGILDEPANDL